MGKPTSNGCSITFISTISSYNLVQGYLSTLPSLAKRPFESKSTRINRKSWVNGKANRPNVSFPIPQTFFSYFHFLFYLILGFPSFVSFNFTFALYLIICLTFINYQITFLGTNSYNHSLVQIHFRSPLSIESLFGLQNIRGNQFGSM